jgi:mannosyltransferase OCH1-like enzyme
MNNNIFQTHKSMSYVKTKPKLIEASTSWLKHSTAFNYYFYTNEMCNYFIKDNFEEQIYKAYEMLPMGVMKADLWRYCIIYKYGGIYADIDTICMYDPTIFLTNAMLTIVPENETHLCQWVFSAPANSPILKSIIDLSVERILTTQIKGENIIHYLTGPGVFTDGIEKYLTENKKPIFRNKKYYQNYPDADILKVFKYDNFHKNIVRHLFAGQDQDGWVNESSRLIKKY